MSRPIHLILSPGTRVVTRNDTKPIGATAESALIPSGTVGVIIDSPLDAKHAYKIRFNDDTQAMLRRSEFSILKEFKSEGFDTTAHGMDFDDWEPFIIYRCIVGSQAFGLSDEKSDTDRRGIYLPPADLHWSLYGVPEQIEPHRTGPEADTAETYWELQKFLVMALKANPNILECLHTPLVEYASPLAQELLASRKAFLSKLIFQTYNGYVMSQFKKLEQDLRAHSQIKWKHAMHLIRLLLSGITALREGELRVRLDEHRETLLQIKRGEMPWGQLNSWRLALHKDFEEAFVSTALHERPDYAWANAFLLKARNHQVLVSKEK